MNRRTFLLLAAAVTLLAFGQREWYVLAALTPYPFVGDSGEYLRYAVNLVHAGTFSHAMPAVPDDYRGPGYPLFLAALLGKEATVNEFLFAVRQAQAVVGTLTVVAAMALARLWLPRGAALASGLLLALWPHHIVATDSVLVEVLFGFLLVASLLGASLSLRDHRLAIPTGIVFGAAYLVNPLIALLPFAVLGMFWRAGMKRAGVAVLAISLLAPAGWALRSATLPPGEGRAGINVVQGSFPSFHDDWRAQRVNPKPFARIVREMRDVEHGNWQPTLHRLASDPLGDARWYLLEKPILLWDWDIKLGCGGIYFLWTDLSPFDAPLLDSVQVIYSRLNPLLTVLVLLFSVALLRHRNPAAMLCGLTVLYLTGIHVVFQAEPRYAIAYRPLECVVVAGGVCWIIQSSWTRVGSARRRAYLWWQRARLAGYRPTQ